jgi:ABC-2 type transport system ATP-binding protein
VRRLVRRRWWVLAAVAVLAVGATAVIAASRTSTIVTRDRMVTGTPESGTQVELDTTEYVPARTPAPAILLAHGFGGSKADLDTEARSLADHGYVVLTYSARGFGRSGGLIHLDAPAYEVADAKDLVSYLATLPEVLTDGVGDPRVGVAGSSYGGALALLLGAYDPRVDAIGADITWSDLTQALFPNGADGPGTVAPEVFTNGVFKKMWASELFASAAVPPAPSAAATSSSAGACGRFAPDLCAAYQQAAQTGRPDASLVALLSASSPRGVLDRIAAPTLISQGEDDSLFTLTQADENATGIAAHGTPVRVVWRSGGHDGGTSTADLVTTLEGWFDPVLKDHARPAGSFDVAVPGTGISSATGRAVAETLHAATGYPSRRTDDVRIAGAPQTVQAPAGGSPAAISTVPGVGSLLTAGSSAGGVSRLSSIPGQVARFASAPLPTGLLVAGASTVTLDVTAVGDSETRAAGPTGSVGPDQLDATLFASVHLLGAGGTDALPAGLVAPVRLTGLTPGVPQTVTITLPAVVANVPAGDRLVVEVGTTDLAYALPTTPRAYSIALTDGVLSVATVDGQILRSGHPWIWLLAGLVAIMLLVVGVTAASTRQRHRRSTARELVDVPVAVDGLVKQYGDGYRAVDGVTFRVEAGQVVGLLGPNGAGKTTTLRVLMGLIRPTSGTVRVFGELVEAGAPVLSRIGSFIEGPGLLPHLSGRDNLRLFWAATGRPTRDSELDTALEIAGLGESVDRLVKTYSQGMRQRLAIAQAMLGLPEILVLDEPTNGLDPLQIAEMREVLRRYATTGRTVVISSHLLAEVEQTCSHVVVMHKGRLVAVGSVAEIAAAGRLQLAVDDPAQAVRILADAGVRAEAVPARRSLEDIFIEMVGNDRD